MLGTVGIGRLSDLVTRIQQGAGRDNNPHAESFNKALASTQEPSFAVLGS